MSDCYFYVLALAPDLKPERVKLGVARCVATRLAVHRTAAPTAELVAFWHCERRREGAAIQAGTVGCKGVGGEVFDTESISEAVSRLTSFFGAEPETVAPKRIARAYVGKERDDSAAFRRATDILLRHGVTVATIAEANGVSEGSILRARMESGQRRSPPKGWEPVLRSLAEARSASVQAEAVESAAALTSLAAELADA